MTALTIIFGIIMILCGLSCMFTPFATFLSMGYFFGIMFFVYGLMGLIRACTKKDVHVLQIVTSVLAVFVGIMAILNPGSTLAIDRLMLGFIAAWFMIQGLAQIAVSWKVKDVDKCWIWPFIIGILGVLLGIYSLVHPMVAAVTAGFLIGFSFLQTGLNTLTLGIAARKNSKEQ